VAGPQGQGGSGEGDSGSVARLRGSGPIRGTITLLKRMARPQGQGGSGQGDSGSVARLRGSSPIRGNITLLKRTAGPEGQGGNPSSSEEGTDYLCYAVADDGSATLDHNLQGTYGVVDDADLIYYRVWPAPGKGSTTENGGTDPTANAEVAITDTLVFSPTHILIPISSVCGVLQKSSVVLYLDGAENRAQRAVNEGKFAAEIAPLENEVARKLSADGRHVAWIVDSPFTSTNYGNLNGFAEAWISANATTRVAGSNTQTDNVLVYVFATPKPAVHR
ncbi:MAG: hypothetical protein N2971_06390, partial [Chlorobi bacterium]|nr:hypothetical protein [Chlorobiota bacterium]